MLEDGSRGLGRRLAPGWQSRSRDEESRACPRSQGRGHHEPTGMIVSCQDQKSSHKNLEKALKVLRSRLYELELAKKQAADSEKRMSMVSSGDRSAKIRTYNYPQGRVTEHRIGLTLYDLSNIINGDIQKIISELMMAENTEKLKADNGTI